MGPRSIGLALSGGGARGLTHVGVLRALDELGVKPTHISGTSAGALIGGMYAAGIAPDDIWKIIEHQKFLSPGNFALKNNGLLRLKPLVDMLEKNLPIRSFEKLRVKLFVTATNIEDGISHTFDSGDMVLPMVASAAVPVMFPPVIIDGKPWLDGGVINNFPVEPVQACDLVIGSNVSTWPVNFSRWSRVQIAQRCFHLSMSHYVKEKSKVCHIFIDPPIGHYGAFEKRKFKELMQLGYDQTMAHKSRLTELMEKAY